MLIKIIKMYILRYRTSRFEFSILTFNNLSVPSKNIIDSLTNQQMLLNLEISNQSYQVRLFLLFKAFLD